MKIVIDIDDFKKYIKQPCLDCKDKNTDWCDGSCHINEMINFVENYIKFKTVHQN